MTRPLIGIDEAVQQLAASGRGLRVLRKLSEMMDAGLTGLDHPNRVALVSLIVHHQLRPGSVRDALDAVGID